MKRIILTWVFLLGLTLSNCVKNTDFEIISNSCEEHLEVNATFDDVKALYKGDLVQIQENLIIEGYINSSDRAGNFFSVLHFQDQADVPSGGLQIGIDLFESHLLFEPGSKIFIKTKGLYLGKTKGVFRLGGTFSAFGNTSVGRLPALKIAEHLILACDEPLEIRPMVLTLDNLTDDMVNTLVEIENVEVVEEELGLTFALAREETERTLTDCDGNMIILLNSGFSDFQAELLPDNNGKATGVLLKENNDFLLAIRSLNDLEFIDQRCSASQLTSTQLLFSELADPNNNTGARFVELYNAASEPLNLDGWSVRRYTNDNLEFSSTVDLTGFTIGGESTFVISPNGSEFESVYGFAPDLSVGTNSPADSNGDDNLELVDPFGAIIDLFGVPGEDGSGTNHEFEDGRAVRNSTITMGNPVYTFTEWSIHNDTGEAGTTNLPKNAPEDFTPGVR